MVTQKPRVNMVLEPDEFGELAAFAKREGKSLSDMARTLLVQMMEIQEDVSLASLAAKRRISFSPADAMSHEEVWGSRMTPSLTEKGRNGVRRHLPSRRRKARSSRNPR